MIDTESVECKHSESESNLSTLFSRSARHVQASRLTCVGACGVAGLADTLALLKTDYLPTGNVMEDL